MLRVRDSRAQISLECEVCPRCCLSYLRNQTSYGAYPSSDPSSRPNSACPMIDHRWIARSSSPPYCCLLLRNWQTAGVEGSCLAGKCAINSVEGVVAMNFEILRCLKNRYNWIFPIHQTVHRLVLVRFDQRDARLNMAPHYHHRVIYDRRRSAKTCIRWVRAL